MADPTGLRHIEWESIVTGAHLQEIEERAEVEVVGFFGADVIQYDLAITPITRPVRGEYVLGYKAIVSKV